MKQILFTLSMLSLLLINGCSQRTLMSTNGSKKVYELAVKNVKIFDSQTKNILENKTILINADTIASIVDSSQKITALNSIEGNGRLITPGFIDTHVHLILIYGDGDKGPEFIEKDSIEPYQKKLAEQYLKYGTTTILDMGQPESWIQETIKWQKNPSPNFPNLFITGGALISDLPWDKNPPMQHTKIPSPEAGKMKVDEYANLDIEYIKLYWKLEDDEMKAIVDEAKKRNMTCFAHIDQNISSIPSAMQLGVKNFEHFFTLIASTLNLRENWSLLNKKYGLGDTKNADEYAAKLVLFFQFIKENPELDNKLMTLIDDLGEQGVSISTTLNVLAAASQKAYYFSSFSPIPIRDSPDISFTEEQKVQLKGAFDTFMEYLIIAHKKDVKLRIGTDCRNGGQAMLSELMLLAEYGFSMDDILKIATLNGAEAMHIEKNFGSIATGKKADLILFSKNPFENYRNLMSEKLVIKGGKVYESK